jgi:hypothetical protein
MLRGALTAVSMIYLGCGVPAPKTTTGPTSTTVAVTNSASDGTFTVIAQLVAPDGGTVPSPLDGGAAAPTQFITVLNAVQIASGATSPTSAAFAAPSGTVVTWKFSVSTDGMQFTDGNLGKLSNTLNQASGNAIFIWNADDSMSVGY